LQNPRKLRAVTTYVDRKVPEEMTVPPEGWEIWLRDESVRRDDFNPVRTWVNHASRTLGYEPPLADGSSSYRDVTGDERLDHEYRYWSFMETHPAHCSLPSNAYSEALDILTWSYSDKLLKTHGHLPLPFTQHECHEMMEILRSTSGSESNVQAAVQTRVVSRVLKRVVQWRQHHFRPEKPLPRDAITESLLRRQRAPRGTCADFVLAWLCFGIPYFFANRHGHQRYDEESGLMRSSGPFLVMGASVCLVAAIILSASVTFLALPGLDNIARTAGFVAILGSTASLASSVIAAFRHQTEVQRMTARGGEGFVTVSTGGTLLLSLPAVFLAWAIVAFVTGLVIYAFRGSVIVDPSHWKKFAEYTKWTTVGVLGFSAGLLLTSMFFVRR